MSAPNATDGAPQPHSPEVALTPLTQKELEIAIVRMGEKYPTRIGLWSAMHNADCTDHCIAGQIAHDGGACRRGVVLRRDHPLYAGIANQDTDFRALVFEMVNLNNEGVPWGEIPKRLGLVPGEAPAEVPAAEPVPVVA